MDHAVIRTATELFEARHYPSVVALVTDALEECPEHVPLLLLRAQAHIALRRDLEAQADLRDLIRIEPSCSLAYRLLGVLAARREEHESAAIFFREALRLDPGDTEAADWLRIVGTGSTSRPAAAAQKIPAPAAAAGRFPAVRVAKGTRPPTEERTTEPRVPRLAAGSEPKLAPTPAPVSLPPRRPSIPEMPGFGEYLVATGILTRERLRAAQAYQRSMRVHLSTAIVTLGLATPQRIEWAAVAHQAELGSGRGQ